MLTRWIRRVWCSCRVMLCIVLLAPPLGCSVARVQNPGPFVEYRQTNAMAIQRAVVNIDAAGGARVHVKDNSPDSSQVDQRMVLTADELAYLRLLIRSGRFFEQQDGVAPLVGGHQGVLHLRVVLDGRDHRIRFGHNDDLAPLLRLLGRIQQQATIMHRLEAGELIYFVASAISPRMSGPAVLRPSAFVEPLKQFITDCNDIQELTWTIEALSQLVAPDEFAGFVWRQMQAADSDRKALLAQTISRRGVTGASADHLAALKPLFRQWLAQTEGTGPDVRDPWVVRRMREVLDPTEPVQP